MTTLIAQTAISSLTPVFVGAGISACVSFLIFALTQIFLFHKSRSDVLRSKLEELWETLIEVMRRTRPLTEYSGTFTEETQRNLNERATLLIEALLSPTPYVALYFPILSEKYSSINHACGELAKLMRKSPVKFQQIKSAADIYTDGLQIAVYKEELQAASKKAKDAISEMLEYLRINQGMLIKTPKNVLIAKWEEWSGQ